MWPTIAASDATWWWRRRRGFRGRGGWGTRGGRGCGRGGGGFRGSDGRGLRGGRRAGGNRGQGAHRVARGPGLGVRRADFEDRPVGGNRVGNAGASAQAAPGTTRQPRATAGAAARGGRYQAEADRIGRVGGAA